MEAHNPSCYCSKLSSGGTYECKHWHDGCSWPKGVRFHDCEHCGTTCPIGYYDGDVVYFIPTDTRFLQQKLKQAKWTIGILYLMVSALVLDNIINSFKQ